MHHIWNGDWPTNSAPQIKDMQLNNQSSGSDVVLRARQSYQANVHATDPDRDRLQYLWEIKPESEATQEGGDKEAIPPTIRGLIDQPNSDRITLETPREPGAYRLFVYVRDGMGHAGHANIPFLVE
jgi:hypothetical protein